MEEADNRMMQRDFPGENHNKRINISSKTV